MNLIKNSDTRESASEPIQPNQIISVQENSLQVAWLAGFIDGEGSIGIHRERDKRKGDDYFHLRASLQIANTNLESLLKAKQIIGAGSVIEQKGRYQKNPKNKIGYSYKLREPNRLLNILLELIPYLTIKQRQAIITVDYLDRRLSQRGRGRYNPYLEEDLQNWQLLKVFNLKGVNL